MQIAEAIEDSRAFDTQGRLSFALTAGMRYVLHDGEVDGGAGDGALRPICRLDDQLPRYDGQPLTRERLLAPHIGGLGDGILLMSCLAALRRRYPECTIDVPCPGVHHPLLSLFDNGIPAQCYPLKAEHLARYDYYLTLEDVADHAIHPRFSNLEIFGRCLRTPPTPEAVHLVLPPSAINCWQLPEVPTRRVGIALTKSHFMRAYPVDLVLELTRELLGRQLAVVLLGRSSEIGCELPAAAPLLVNLIDQTPDMTALAAVISQLDLLICPDTLFMHLAGVLRVPTLAVFTSSATRVAGGYPTVHPRTADVPCRPCGAIADRCPAGHAECLVPRHADLHPHRLAEAALSLLDPTSMPAPLAAGETAPAPVE